MLASILSDSRHPPGLNCQIPTRSVPSGRVCPMSRPCPAEPVGGRRKGDGADGDLFENTGRILRGRPVTDCLKTRQPPPSWHDCYLTVCSALDRNGLFEGVPLALRRTSFCRGFFVPERISHCGGSVHRDFVAQRGTDVIARIRARHPGLIPRHQNSTIALVWGSQAIASSWHCQLDPVAGNSRGSGTTS
jgi:hypothetical protein